MRSQNRDSLVGSGAITVAHTLMHTHSIVFCRGCVSVRQPSGLHVNWGQPSHGHGVT